MNKNYTFDFFENKLNFLIENRFKEVITPRSNKKIINHSTFPISCGNEERV